MNYEKPILIDFALEDKAEGINNCHSGASATQRCSIGSSVGGGAQCKNGSSAANCQAGASASSGCNLGSSAG